MLLLYRLFNSVAESFFEFYSDLVNSVIKSNYLVYLNNKIEPRIMAIMITDECINCGACEPECPNNAIYEGGVEWAISEGTGVKDSYQLSNGKDVGADDPQQPVEEDFYFIVPDKCTECKGFHEEPQCAAVCPVDCCVPDPEREETEEVLLARKDRLHL